MPSFTVTGLVAVATSTSTLRHRKADTPVRWGRVRAALVTAWLAWLAVGAQAQQFNFQTYGEDDGLSNMGAGCLKQDRDGFIWVCTENGLFRFDGRRFERVTSSQEVVDVRSLAQGATGPLWIGTDSDLYEHAANGSLQPVRPGGRAVSLTSLFGQIVPLDRQSLLVVENGHVLRLDRTPKGAWTEMPLFSAARLAAEPWLGDISLAVRTADGNLWLGCGTALCELKQADADAQHVRRWGPRDGVPDTTWRTLLRDRTGRLWARGVAGLVVLAPDQNRFERRDPPAAQLTSSDSYAPMIEDPQGRIVTRIDTGLAVWDDGRWHSYGPRNGLPTSPVASLLADADGGLWIGLFGKGVSRWLGYGNWEGWTAAQGIEHDVVWGATRGNDGSLVINTNAGCRRLVPEATEALPCGIAGLPKGQLYGMQRTADGAVALGLRPNELYRVAPDGRSATKIATLPRFLGLMLDPDGDSIWAATRNGPYLVRRDPGTPNSWRADTPSGMTQPVGDMARGADGSLWFLVEEDGLLQRTPDGRWQAIQLDDPTAKPASLQRVAVAPDGTVWLALSTGVARLAFTSGKQAHVDRIDESKLRGASITFLRFDRRGWLWVGTDTGLLVFDGTLWRHIDRNEGLVWNDTDSIAFFEDADGSLWIGTTGGLAHLKHPESIQQAVELTARIVTARYGEQSLSAAASSEAMRIPWASEAAFDVRVAAMRPALSKGSVFRYRIVGLSNEWFETANPDIHTPSLQPGRYRLEVIAKRPSAGLVSKPATLAFEVLAPWWRSAWFQTLMATAVVAALAAAWRHRTGVLQARHRHLERLLERATRDPLTGLWNRATILDMLADAVAKARANGTSLAIAMIDIDHFKRVNDTFGHLAGDAVLRAIGQLLTAHVRQGDAIGRYGGEELLLLMPGMRPAQPLQTLERLRLLIAQTEIRHDNDTLRVTASLGVEWLDEGTTDGTALIGRADVALYAAKSGGRNRIAYAGAGSVLPICMPDDSSHAHAA